MVPEAAHEEVISVTEYLRNTIAGIDKTVRDWQIQRAELAIKLSVIEAATDPDVAAAVSDYESRVAEGRPYESAESIEDIIREASSRLLP
jgi:hypothetical protein